MDKKILQKMRKEHPEFSDVTLEKLYLHELVRKRKATASQLMRLSYLTNTISFEEYEGFIEIERQCGEEC